MCALLFLDIRLDNIVSAYQTRENLTIYSTHLNEFARPIKKYDDVAIVSYAAGDPEYYAYQSTLELSAHDNGIDRILTCHPRDIDQKFYETHKEILDMPKGVGYWLWKPYIILDAMNRIAIFCI